jgi:hypothetical protein
MRVGIAHHYGWAIAVTATDEHRVVDRRRIELLDGDLPAAPVHHVGGPHTLHLEGKEPIGDDELAALVAQVRAAAVRTTANSLDQLARDVGSPIQSISLRAWPDDFPTDIATQRRSPYEAQADSVMYRQILAELADARGWRVHLFNANDVERDATAILGARAEAVLYGPRKELGTPWAKDHRMALAATVLAS